MLFGIQPDAESEGLPRFEGIETSLSSCLTNVGVRPKACPDLRGLRLVCSLDKCGTVFGPKACPDLRGLRQTRRREYRRRACVSEGLPRFEGIETQ